MSRASSILRHGPGDGPGEEAGFVLIRHGESTWNAAGRWQGHGDPPLSGRGREQARRLASELVGAGIEVIVSSDLRRAVETAAALGEAIGLAPRTDARLRELDVGDWTGLTRVEIAARDAAALARFESGDPEAPADSGECRRDIAERVRAACADLAAAHAGRRVAVVAHLGVARALLPGCELGNAECRRVSAAELTAPAAVPVGPARPAAY
jgi:broad specificity phosphatase PhoE